MHYNNFNFFCFIKSYDISLLNNLPKNTSVIYRNYKEAINEKKILLIKKFCKKTKLKFFLSNKIKLAIKLDLDGAYIPSFNKKFNHNSYSLKKKFILLGSAHNLKEIRIKEYQKIENIFLSPIYSTKNNKSALGIYKFRYLVTLTSKKITCLGGINNKNIKQIQMLKNNNIAGISFFEKH
jgi:thiamine-phosphate pyrophosphorylase